MYGWMDQRYLRRWLPFASCLHSPSSEYHGDHRTGPDRSKFLPYRDRFPNVVIFASGVANSHTTDAQAYEREYQLLYDTLRICAAEDQQIVYFSSAGSIYGAMDLPRYRDDSAFPDLDLWTA